MISLKNIVKKIAVPVAGLIMAVTPLSADKIPSNIIEPSKQVMQIENNEDYFEAANNFEDVSSDFELYKQTHKANIGGDLAFSFKTGKENSSFDKSFKTIRIFGDYKGIFFRGGYDHSFTNGVNEENFGSEKYFSNNSFEQRRGNLEIGYFNQDIPVPFGVKGYFEQGEVIRKDQESNLDGGYFFFNFGSSGDVEFHPKNNSSIDLELIVDGTIVPSSYERSEGRWNKNVSGQVLFDQFIDGSLNLDSHHELAFGINGGGLFSYGDQENSAKQGGAVIGVQGIYNNFNWFLFGGYNSTSGTIENKLNKLEHLVNTYLSFGSKDFSFVVGGTVSFNNTEANFETQENYLFNPSISFIYGSDPEKVFESIQNRVRKDRVDSFESFDIARDSSKTRFDYGLSAPLNVGIFAKIAGVGDKKNVSTGLDENGFYNIVMNTSWGVDAEMYLGISDLVPKKDNKDVKFIGGVDLRGGFYHADSTLSYLDNSNIERNSTNTLELYGRMDLGAKFDNRMIDKFVISPYSKVTYQVGNEPSENPVQVDLGVTGTISYYGVK